MILTSYYGNKDLRQVEDQYKLVAISQSIPKGFKGEIFKGLAPSWELVKMKNEAQYAAIYWQTVLSKLDPLKIVKSFDNSILLCWEAPGEFCHRRLVAEWLKEATGEDVPEFVFERQPDSQLTLF